MRKSIEECVHEHCELLDDHAVKIVEMGRALKKMESQAQKKRYLFRTKQPQRKNHLFQMISFLLYEDLGRSIGFAILLFILSFYLHSPSSSKWL